MPSATIPAAGYMTYRDRIDESAVGEVKGPTAATGEVLTIVSVEPIQGGGSRVGFSYGARCTRCLQLITDSAPGQVTVDRPYEARFEHEGACP